jgi:hypothetical protein
MPEQTYPMNPEVKAEWVAALRSREFTQGKGVLRRKRGGVDSYCCLGVLCELATRAGVAQSRIVHGDSDVEIYEYNEAGSDTLGMTSYLPSAVTAWAQLSPLKHHTPHNPAVTYQGERTTLAHLNDGYTPFGVIADLIEEQL